MSKCQNVSYYTCFFIYTLLLGLPYTLRMDLTFIISSAIRGRMKALPVFVSRLSFLTRERNPRSNSLGEQQQIYILRLF